MMTRFKPIYFSLIFLITAFNVGTAQSAELAPSGLYIFKYPSKPWLRSDYKTKVNKALFGSKMHLERPVIGAAQIYLPKGPKGCISLLKHVYHKAGINNEDLVLPKDKEDFSNYNKLTKLDFQVKQSVSKKKNGDKDLVREISGVYAGWGVTWRLAMQTDTKGFLKKWTFKDIDDHGLVQIIFDNSGGVCEIKKVMLKHERGKPYVQYDRDLCNRYIKHPLMKLSLDSKELLAKLKKVTNIKDNTQLPQQCNLGHSLGDYARPGFSFWPDYLIGKSKAALSNNQPASARRRVSR